MVLTLTIKPMLLRPLVRRWTTMLGTTIHGQAGPVVFEFKWRS